MLDDMAEKHVKNFRQENDAMKTPLSAEAQRQQSVFFKFLNYFAKSSSSQYCPQGINDAVGTPTETRIMRVLQLGQIHSFIRPSPGQAIRTL